MHDVVEDHAAQHGHARLSTFGVGAAIEEAQWRAVLRQLVALGYLATEGEYGTLGLTASSREVLRGGVTMLLREAAAAPARQERVSRRHTGYRRARCRSREYIDGVRISD